MQCTSYYSIESGFFAARWLYHPLHYRPITSWRLCLWCQVSPWAELVVCKTHATDTYPLIIGWYGRGSCQLDSSPVYALMSYLHMNIATELDGITDSPTHSSYHMVINAIWKYHSTDAKHLKRSMHVEAGKEGSSSHITVQIWLVWPFFTSCDQVDGQLLPCITSMKEKLMGSSYKIPARFSGH